jgi:DNA-directed RNA polymerase specialized sigma24 family protein
MGYVGCPGIERRRGKELLDTEVRLHERVVARDQGALVEWVRRIGGDVYCTALSCTGDVAAAEDMTEALFLEVWRQPALFHPARGPLTLQLVRRMSRTFVPMT